MDAFILGNGPSLGQLDLTRLTGRFVVTVNLIHKHPSWEDGFRPSLWVFGDNYGNPHFKENLALHLQQKSYDCWVKSDILAAVCNERMEAHERFWWVDYPQVRPYQNCFHRRDMLPPTRWHWPHICNYTGSLHAAVQIAVWHYGVDRIYFLGIDGNIKVGKAGNHFTDDYQANWYGRPMVERINYELSAGHDIISAELHRADVSAVNLTPNSVFRQYARSKLEEVLQKKGERQGV